MTPVQICCVLSDIAEQASMIDRMVVMLTNSSDERDLGAMRRAIETGAERIGTLADMALWRIHSVLGPVRGDAEDWMMPPLYFDVADGDVQVRVNA
jgi:hypothetical protein